MIDADFSLALFLQLLRTQRRKQLKSRSDCVNLWHGIRTKNTILMCQSYKLYDRVLQELTLIRLVILCKL